MRMRAGTILTILGLGLAACGGHETQQAVIAPSNFAGPARELETLRKWLQQKRLVVILGIAGIGKTALAARLVSETRGPRPVFWYRFREWDTLRNFLGPMADFLPEFDES